MKFLRHSVFVSSAALACLVAGFPAKADVNVVQHHNHLSRDGLYIDNAFTPASVAGLHRDLTFDGTISGNVFAQPLYIEGGPNGKAMVIAVTASNNVYALDALNGKVLWSTNVGPPVPSGMLPCGNVIPAGITGTPVIDLPSRALLFDAMISDSITGAPPKHFIFSLNADTGNLNPGWPVNVDAIASSGNIVFNSFAQGQRGALAVVGNNLYVPYGGLFGDCNLYYGWVVSVPLISPSDAIAWSTTAPGGGAWSVGGVASDGVDVFVATGNTRGTNVWSGGEAIIRLPSSLVLTGGTTNYWAPTNWVELDSSDIDIGGSGPLLVDVPGATPSQLIVALGKDGNAYLLNRTNLGGVSTPLAQANVCSNEIIQAAATYQTTKGTYFVAYTPPLLSAFRITPASPPAISNAWSVNPSGDGSPFVTSTDGTNNVIVWTLGCDGDHQLHAYDADTGASLYSGGGTNELMGGTRHMNTGIAARGRIFVANDNKVYAFVPAATNSPQTKLSATFSGAYIIISWTPAGGTLQSSPAFGTGSTWSPVGTVNPATVPLSGDAQFFRVGP